MRRTYEASIGIHCTLYIASQSLASEAYRQAVRTYAIHVCAYSPPANHHPGLHRNLPLRTWDLALLSSLLTAPSLPPPISGLFAITSLHICSITDVAWARPPAPRCLSVTPPGATRHPGWRCPPRFSSLLVCTPCLSSFVPQAGAIERASCGFVRARDSAGLNRFPEGP